VEFLIKALDDPIEPQYIREACYRMLGEQMFLIQTGGHTDKYSDDIADALISHLQDKSWRSRSIAASELATCVGDESLSGELSAHQRAFAEQMIKKLQAAEKVEKDTDAAMSEGRGVISIQQDLGQTPQ
jgi:S-adenosylmethionine synthetase